MKASRYNIFVSVEDDKKLLYNTLTRKYIILDSSSQNAVYSLLKEPNSQQKTDNQNNLLDSLIRNMMIIDDDFDEISYIEFEENKYRFQDQSFSLIIQPTLDCNFRCTYCYEKHAKITMDDQTADKILTFVDNISKKVNILKISWFGGEPLLEIDRIIQLTAKFKIICEKNNCKYKANMASNGYLFTDEIIDQLSELEIKYIQITLDGCREYHNKKRPLENGEGTFDKVMENIIKLSNKNIKINFRVNVDEENYSHISDVFKLIPKENRGNIRISIANLFQNSQKINVYEIYRKSFDEGYIYSNKINKLVQCELCSKNGMAIEPTGRIVPCSPCAEKGLSFGYLDDNGKFVLENSALYFKLKTVSALKRERCRECIELPMCMGKCKYSMYVDNEICNSAVPDGLTVEDRIKLHYYSDLQQETNKEVGSV